MDLYTKTSYQLAKSLTETYSTSFSMSSTLFAGSIRPHIYAIYGLVRIADEIVDSYHGEDAAQQLDELESQTAEAIASGYSSNPLVHAFATTARQFEIDAELIAPFFNSMRRDLKPVANLTKSEYDTYIHGSAEVVGLMCLKVFSGTAADYDKLAEGARALGRAYQKVNFLRDIKADNDELGRWYFPNCSFETLDEIEFKKIVADIKHDFATAKPVINQLPGDARQAIATSYAYYYRLLQIIERTPLEQLKRSRIRVPNNEKLRLLVKARLGVPIL